MNVPMARGTPVDDGRVTIWLERFSGYRVSVTGQRIRTWLAQFDLEDTDMGARVLDAVMFLGSQDIEEALRRAAIRLPGWHKSKAKRQGKWRFVGFLSSGGESGDMMTYKFRTALGLTNSRYDELFSTSKRDLLKENLGASDSVVFIDDFAGTGKQACDYWETLAELLPSSPKSYLILIVAGQQAVEKIGEKTESRLVVIAGHTLDSSDNVFTTECRHFTKSEKNRLLEYCKKADRRLPRGYGDCGLVLVFAHKTPNNSIPILHSSNRNNWRGLFPRRA